MIKYLLFIFISAGLTACRSKPSIVTPLSGPVADSSKSGAIGRLPLGHDNPDQSATMTFIAYLDDGDYFQLLAERNNDTLSFINDISTERTLNRGDGIWLVWKDSTVTITGDHDSRMPAKILLSIKKTADGPVSRFRKIYGKKLKYTWETEKEYSSSYLDKIYRITEYYLSKTRNPLLKMAINDRQGLTYSIESTQRDAQPYTIIGIAPIGRNGSNVVQWLYIKEDSYRLYEYNLPEDKLVRFD